MTFYKSLSLVVISLLISSCGKKDLHLDKDGATFYVDSITASISADNVSDNHLVNRKFINFTACIKDNAMNSAILGLSFNVSAASVTTDVKKTDERGCFIWQELFSYNPLDNEGAALLTRTVTALDGHSGKEEVRLSYNPWKDKITFLKRESANLSDSYILNYSFGGHIMRSHSATGEKLTSKIDIVTTMRGQQGFKQSYISNLSLKFLKRDFNQYEITPSLNLVIAHQYRFKFNAAMVRKTLEGTKVENIPMGKLKFYFVLLKEGYDPNNITQTDIISANEFIGTANLGQFIADVTLRFKNISALANRMTGLLTVTATDDSNNFGESTFEGSLIPIVGAGAQSIDFIPSLLNAKNLFISANIFHSQQTSLNGITLFEKYSGFVQTNNKPVTFNVPSGFNKTKTESIDIFTIFKKKQLGQFISPVELSLYGKALCYKYFDGNNVPSAYSACLREANRMITVVRRDFVEKINNPIPRKVGLPHVESLTMSTNFDFSETKNQSKGISQKTAWGWNAGLTGELGVNSAIGPTKLSASIGGKISTGQEWYSISGTASSTSDTTKVSTAKSVTITSEGFKFAFDATSRSCFLITPTVHLQSLLRSTSPAGKYFCEDQTTTGLHEETYYFLNEARGLATSPLSDNMSSEDSPWRMFIRGSHTHNLFAQVLAQKNTKLVLQKMPEDQILKQFNEFYITQEFPGMLSP